MKTDVFKIKYMAGNLSKLIGTLLLMCDSCVLRTLPEASHSNSLFQDPTGRH